MPKSKGDEEYEECQDQPQLAVLKAKREVYFQRMQQLYDLAKSSDMSPDDFLHKCSTIDEIHSKFEQILDDYNSLCLELNPKYQIDYKVWLRSLPNTE
ncbi:hypothetical protein K1T71_013324 [Dendrolimus kikuchii]|uniref:Uncharacterized protein n=1 Tax=Dendrolimus kikuchii TaxID=765133 RepID=A0ACC1CHQ4_9NEOP|nr:hypothetical protein K1T71_013324 [Dendrolimus kikuchii]